MRQFSLEFKDRMADENDYDYSGNATYSLLRNYRSKSNIVKFANFFAKTIPNRLKHNDLIAEDTSDGYIKIINYPFNTSVIKSIADSVSVDTSENIAVLCRTNQAVLTVYSMLKANGINVKYLTSKGIDSQRLIAEFYGYDMEKYNSGNKELNLANRRVSFKVK
jgi:superfamily I DNA/RNA helicase